MHDAQQARNQRVAIGQLPPPKFSQTYVFVGCSTKLHHFAPPKYQLVAALMPSNIKKICSFFQKGKCARKIFIVFVTLSDLNRTSNRAVTHTYKMHEN